MTTARVVTVSTRCAAGQAEDTSGPELVAGLRALGIDADGPVVVPDGEPVVGALEQAVADGAVLVLTTGGTGLSPTDRTPEMTGRVVDRLAPGLAEAVRAYGVREGVATAIVSRGIAGLAGRCLIVNLPGSRGGARDGLAALAPVLPHVLDQLGGGDHRPAGGVS